MPDFTTRTALELSVADWRRYHPAETSRQRSDAENAERARRRRRALRTARRAAALLREYFGASRVVLFGSLTRWGGFTPWSDIDLAAWGIPAARFYAAVAAVTGLSAEFKVDLVDPDFCRPALRVAIDREGLDL